MQERCVHLESKYEELEECKTRAAEAMQIMEEYKQHGIVFCVDRRKYLSGVDNEQSYFGN